MLLTGRAERVGVTSSADGDDADYRVEQYEGRVEDNHAPPSFERCEEL